MESVNPSGHCSEGSNPLLLAASGDGFHGHLWAEAHISLGSYSDPWCGREQPKKPRKARTALLNKN